MEKTAEIKALESLNINYEVYEHGAFDTCETSAEFHKLSGKPGARGKNLFLRNKNGKQHFLVVLPHEKDFDKVAFRELSGQKCSFASDERLDKYLKVKPGHVSPLSLINDQEHQVQVYIDETLINQSYLHLHPGLNTLSVQITPGELERFLKALNYDYIVHNF